MKLSKKFIILSAFSLLLAGISGLLSSKTSNNTKQIAKAESEYTVYRNEELGFATRDPNDTRIVKGDADGGMQTKGNVLNEKSELRFSFKKTLDNYWMGVGGYAVYVSSSTTIRFLYLGYNSNGAYSRNAEISNLTLKTADGATNLADVDGGKLFTNYTNAVLRFDLSNPASVKAQFYVEFNGVTYYTFNGSTKIDVVTYTHQPSGFATEDKNRAMFGANATDSGVSILKFQSREKTLDNIISAGSVNFHYSYIDNLFFQFNLSEQIFTRTGYMNDHVNEFLDANNQPINLGDGIIINGQTFNYWRSFNADSAVFPRNDGVNAFPMNVGGQFSPIAIEIQANFMEFKTVVEFIPMDSMTIVFKAGLFAGYYNGVTFTLNNDVTFYSTISTSNGPSRVVLTKDQPWEMTRLGIKAVEDWGEQTASKGGKFRRYAMWTNIPRDAANITQGCPADNYRYMYDNILLNDLPISHYHAWARGNSKDFANLSDASTQNPDYELGHPTNSANTVYDLAIRVVIVTDQPNYVLFLDVPNQLVTDLSLASLTFTIRDGSDWLSTKGGSTVILRYDAAGNAEDIATVEAFANNKLHMVDYTESLGYCNDSEHHYYLTAKEAYNGLSDTQKVAFQNNAQFAAAKARYEAWAAFNNDANPYDGNNNIVSTNSYIVSSVNDSGDNTVVLVAIVMVLASVCSTFVIVLVKKRRCNK